MGDHDHDHDLSARARDLSWLVSGFADRVAGVTSSLVVTSDGLPLAASARLDRATADQLSAIASGLVSLTAGAARCLSAGGVRQIIVELEAGFLFVQAISDGSALAVLARAGADLGLVGYEMGLLVERVGDSLTPALRDELQAALIT